MDKQSIKEFYNKIAEKRAKWYKSNIYYHKKRLNWLNFYMHKKSSVIEFGCKTGDLLATLSPQRGVGVDISSKMIEIARSKYKGLEFICSDVEEFENDEKFDYIIISGILGEIEDIQNFLNKIKSLSTPDTRVIVSYYNPLWQPILKLAERTGLKMPEMISNWLSLEDIENFFQISGYEVITHEFFLLFPIYIPIISEFLNRFIAKLPIIRRLCLITFVVARPLIHLDKANLTASVVITCRNEKENIEGLVQRIPKIGKHTETLFVEGFSTDGTREEILRMIEKYPDKDIKLLVEETKMGQGPAFRKGFDAAKGDFILWLEADLTTPPEELSKFWDAYIQGRCEYVNGSRLVYPMGKKAMPFINFIGNRFFGNLFTVLLGQRFTDTLCGLKGISKRNYLRIRREIAFFGDFDPFGDFELIFGVAKNNLKVAEIPVKYVPRSYGKTKTKPFRHGWLLLKMSWIAFHKFKLL